MSHTKRRGESSQRVAIAIMAAGKGTRLKSKHRKVFHDVGDNRLLRHVSAAATKVVSAQDIYAIIGHEAERVRQAVAHTGINFVLQAPQRGTGHALMVARDALAHYDQVIVLSGDSPLITPETITKLRDFHSSKKAAMTILTSVLPDPTGYGRVIRKSTKSDDVQAIVEQKSATSKQQKVRDINSGFYAFAVKPLFSYIDKLSTNNPHGEFYLTDMAAILGKAKQRVVAVEANDAYEILGGNMRAELVDIDQRLRLAKCRQLMTEGVTIFSPQTCVIDSDVQIGADTTIEPFVQILGNTRIGSDCRIRSYSVIRDCEIADGVLIRPACVLEGATVEAGGGICPGFPLPGRRLIRGGSSLGEFLGAEKIK